MFSLNGLGRLLFLDDAKKTPCGGGRVRWQGMAVAGLLPSKSDAKGTSGGGSKGIHREDLQLDYGQKKFFEADDMQGEVCQPGFLEKRVCESGVETTRTRLS